MPKITFIDSAGTSRTIDAEVGATVMETAIKNDVPGIEAECGGACACATCHVHVEPTWLDRLPPMSDMERAMLDMAAECRPTSRLACQIQAAAALEGLVLHTPAGQH
mgnify:CR=1 FL=1